MRFRCWGASPETSTIGFSGLANLFVLKPPDAHQEKHQREAKQHQHLQYHALRTLPAQGDIEHTLHRPGGRQNTHSTLDCLREQLERIPTAAQHSHHHPHHNAQAVSLRFRFHQGSEHGAQSRGCQRRRDQHHGDRQDGVAPRDVQHKLSKSHQDGHLQHSCEHHANDCAAQVD